MSFEGRALTKVGPAEQIPLSEKSEDPIIVMFDRDIAKMILNNEERQKEIEILFDMAEQIPKGTDMTDEQKVLFSQRFSLLQRFKTEGAEKFTESFAGGNKAGEEVFGEQINIIQEYIDETNIDIENTKKDKKARLDEKNTV